jgi:hypothetical protein
VEAPGVQEPGPVAFSNRAFAFANSSSDNAPLARSSDNLLSSSLSDIAISS